MGRSIFCLKLRSSKIIICILYILLFSAILSLGSCASSRRVNPKRIIKNSKTEHPVYEKETFTSLQKETIRILSQNSFLEYRRTFTDIHGQNLIILAIKSEQEKLLPILFRNNVDVNTKDNLGNTALMYAILYEVKPRIIDSLIKIGAEINMQNNEGKSAFILAAQYGTTPKYMYQLLGYEVDVSLVDDKGKNAWDYLQDNIYLNFTDISFSIAVEEEQQLIEFFKKRKLRYANTIQYSNANSSLMYKNETSTMMWAARFSPRPDRVLDELVDQADPRALDANGSSAIHYAVINPNSNKAKQKAISTLVDLNAPLSLNKEGKTPLLLALEQDVPLHIIEFFVQGQGALSEEVNTNKALFFAAKYTTSLAVHNFLFEYGLSINQEDFEGKNAAYYLAEGVNKNNKELYFLYKQKGLDFGHVDKTGEVAFSYVLRNIDDPTVIDVILNGFTEAQRTNLLLQTNNEKQTMLHIVFQYNKNFEVVEKTASYIDNEALLATKDIYGRIPLSYAAENNCTCAVKYLYQRNPETIFFTDYEEINILYVCSKK